VAIALMEKVSQMAHERKRRGHLPTVEHYARITTLLASDSQPASLQLLLKLYQSFAHDQASYYEWKKANVDRLTDQQMLNMGYEHTSARQVVYHHSLKALRAVNLDNGMSDIENGYGMLDSMRKYNVARWSVTYNHVLWLLVTSKRFDEVNQLLVVMLKHEKVKADRETLARVKMGYKKDTPDQAQVRAIVRVTDDLNTRLPLGEKINCRHYFHDLRRADPRTWDVNAAQSKRERHPPETIHHNKDMQSPQPSQKLAA
jgi:hypothetical protein